MTFHLNALSKDLQNVLREMGPFTSERGLYLGGGTALAIYLGHRVSVDLDWFSEKPLSDPLILAQELKDNGIPFVTGQVDRGTLHGAVHGINVSFLEYRYPLLAWQPLARIALSSGFTRRYHLYEAFSHCPTRLEKGFYRPLCPVEK